MATIIGTNGNDVLFGTSGDDQISGLDGNDRLEGGEGANHLFGGAGDDSLWNSATIGGDAISVLEGGAGADRIHGSFNGIEYVSYAGSNAAVMVNLGTFAASGGDAQGDVLDRSGALDGVIGSAFNDLLTAFDSRAVLEGGAGADHITGNGGFIVASYASSTAGVSVDLFNRTASGGDAQGDVLTRVRGLIGSDHDDVLRAGDTQSAVLRGGAGDDALDLRSSRGGVMEGGAGADTLIGGPPRFGTLFKTATYEHSAAAVTVDLGTGHGFGGDAEGDVLQSVDSVEGSAFGDVLIGGTAAWQAEQLFGEGGDDHLYSRAGGTRLSGGDGVDTVDYSQSAAAVAMDMATGGTLGDAKGDSYQSIEILRGTNFNDSLRGDAGANELEGGAGADILDGRDDIDTASYVHSTAGVTVSLTSGVGIGGDAQGDTLTGFENLRGSAFADTLAGDAGDNALEGGAGADTLYGSFGVDTASYAHSAGGVQVNLASGTGTGGDAEGDSLIGIENLIGSDHNDVLAAGRLNSTLSGGAGDDVLRGSGGEADVFDGGAGFDMVLYNTKHTMAADLQLGIGIGGDALDDTFISIEGLTGSEEADRLLGSDVDNIFYGAGGSDILSGRAGADILSGGAGADQLDGGSGSDIASYYTSFTGVAVNLTTGTASGGDAQGDTLTSIEGLSGSNLGNDSLAGNAGANALRGWGGDDALTGAGGKDTLIGGAGADRFIYGSTADSAVGADADVIGDFSHAQGDRIDMSAIDADTGTVGNQAFTFIGAAAYTGVAGQLRFHSDGVVTTVAGDVNGDGVSDFHIQLSGAIGLVAGDFVL